MTSDEEEDRRMCILYGSQTGSARDVAERVQRTARRRHWTGCCLPLDSYNIADLINERVVVIVVSTTGQGDPPDNMKLFWRFIFRKSLPTTSLSNVQFGLLGLGDSSYGRYNFVAKKLFKRVLQLGAHSLVDLGLADDQHPMGAEFGVVTWLSSWWAKIDEVYPSQLPHIPDSQCLPARYELRVMEESEAPSACDSGTELQVSSSSKLETSVSVPSFTSPFHAPLLSNDRVTAVDHWQDVRLIRLDTTNSGISYSPGDVAMVLPENTDEDVDQFVKLFHLNPDTIIRVSQLDPETPLPAALCQPVTVRHLAKTYLDINGVPRRYFWELLAHFTDSDLEKDKLLEFCSMQGQDDLLAYCYRPHRTVLEVLADFPHATANVPLSYLLDLISPIQPRAFSIASAPSVHHNEIQLLVAVVTYKTSLYTPRRGLCSSWLANLDARLGHTVPVWVRKGSLVFPPAHQPVLLVGPGTGCAPFRSVLHERTTIVSHSQGSLMFFGCRSRSKDFHFAAEWPSIEKAGTAHIYTAFSRDQEKKEYVQDVILAHADQVWQLLFFHHAYVFVAGSAKQMPQSVREALKQVVIAKGQRSEEAAEQFIKDMEIKCLYQTETWS